MNPVLARWLYTVLWWLLTPAIMGYLLWRSRRQPAYRQHWRERWGLYPRLPAIRREAALPTIWVHAVSVGETRAAQPLVDALRARYPRHRILLTHMTPTGRETAAQIWRALAGQDRAGGVVSCYLPYDYPAAVRRFLAYWQPAIGILMETEVWPNLVHACKTAGMPLVLANGRLSARSLRRGQRMGALIRPAMAGLACVIAQTRADAERARMLGASCEVISGNLKFDQPPPPDAVAEGRALRERWLAESASALQHVVVLASTREGEEALLLDSFEPERFADTRFVLVPRHPQRFDEVAQLMRQRLGSVHRRSLGWDGLTPQMRWVLGDSMGEMPLYYGLAEGALIGGSLAPLGGQNLIEACAAGCPVLLGPHTFNFAEASAQAVEAGAAIRVADAADFWTQLRNLLDHTDRLQAMADAGQAFTRQHRGATGRTLDALAPWLPPSS